MITSNKFKKSLSLTILFFLLLLPFYSQVKKNKTRVLFIFDASNSMRTKYDGKPRIDHAKKLFVRFIDSLSSLKNYEFALRMYGSTVKYPPGDCKDTRLVVPFGKSNVATMKKLVNQAKPTGITPIEHSLISSANDFPDNNAVNTIILITDGIEECKGDPCEAGRKLFEKGIIFKPCIIGIGLTKEQAKTFDCVGDYFSYEDQNSFSKIVSLVESRQLLKTSVQVNLLDIASKPSETNVNMTFYDKKTGEVVYNLVHSLNELKNPDTININEIRTYKVVAHTIPPSEISEVSINPGTHTIIPIEAPQGFLRVNIPENYYNRNDRAKYLIKKSDQFGTIQVQDANVNEKLIVGNYDLEVLTLPRTNLEDVKINQSLTKNIEIQEPGLFQLTLPQEGVGAIFQEEKGELKWVCNLNSSKTFQEFILQPGKYLVTFRGKSQKQSIYSLQKKFMMKSNTKVNLDMFH